MRSEGFINQSVLSLTFQVFFVSRVHRHRTNHNASSIFFFGPSFGIVKGSRSHPTLHWGARKIAKFGGAFDLHGLTLYSHVSHVSQIAWMKSVLLDFPLAQIRGNIKSLARVAFVIYRVAISEAIAIEGPLIP